jgi:hypothetical protein
MNKKQAQIGGGVAISLFLVSSLFGHTVALVVLIPALLVGCFAFWRARDPKSKKPKGGDV